MTGELPAGRRARRPVPDDHGRVVAVLDSWWDGLGGPDGARRVACPTSPGNATSVRFHRCLGFDLVPGDDVVAGVPVHRGHDGPGLRRVLSTLTLDGGQLPGWRSRSAST